MDKANKIMVTRVAMADTMNRANRVSVLSNNHLAGTRVMDKVTNSTSMAKMILAREDNTANADNQVMKNMDGSTANHTAVIWVDNLDKGQINLASLQTSTAREIRVREISLASLDNMVSFVPLVRNKIGIAARVMKAAKKNGASKSKILAVVSRKLAKAG